MRVSGMITSEIRPAAYQLVPLSKIVLSGLNGLLIADGVGLGKTISAAFVAVYFSQVQQLPTAIVCSPILVTKWITELKSKFGVSAFAVRSEEHLGTARQEMRLRPLNFYVFANSLLTKRSKWSFPEFGLVVYDEIQNFRNNRTKSYEAALQLAKKSKLRLGLSATPINNSLDDLASELALLLAEENWEAVSALIQDLWDWNKQRVTKPLVTRFVKEKVGRHFARRHVRMVDVTYPESYTQTVNRVLGKTGTEANIYRAVTYLRIAASCPAAFLKRFHMASIRVDDRKLSYAKKILGGRNVKHWLLFVEFEDTARYLASEIEGKPVFVISGQTPIFERDEIIDSFRESPEGVLILTPVGGEGLDLQFCGGIINYDLHWNPMKIEQRIGRIDRIGQAKDRIEVVNFRVLNSIDDHVLRVIFRKLSLTQRSIFATANIVRGRRPVRSPIVRRAIEAELDYSAKLMTAIQLSDHIQQDDYSLLSSIDESFCTPNALKHAALREPLTMLWLKSTHGAELWSESIKREAEKFQEDLERYK
jgi:SNF2 family DNA or RNA helicase